LIADLTHCKTRVTDDVRKAQHPLLPAAAQMARKICAATNPMLEVTKQLSCVGDRCWCHGRDNAASTSNGNILVSPAVHNSKTKEPNKASF